MKEKTQKIIDFAAELLFVALMIVCIYHAANGSTPSLLFTVLMVFTAVLWYTNSRILRDTTLKLEKEREIIEDVLANKDQEIMRLRYLLDKQQRAYRYAVAKAKKEEGEK